MNDAQEKLNKTYQAERKKVFAGKQTRVGALEACLRSIREAGCVPNRKFHAAMKAAKALDALAAQPLPDIPSTTYILVGTNGIETKIEVPDTIKDFSKKVNFIHQAAKERDWPLFS